MAVLLTGATGFVGMEILARLLERSDAEVLMLVRAADDDAAESRVDSTLECLFGSEHDYRDRVSPVRADLERPGLGLSEAERESLAEHVTSVIHSAASI